MIWAATIKPNVARNKAKIGVGDVKAGIRYGGVWYCV